MERKIVNAKEVVRKFGIAYHTVNYYTAMGLLLVVSRAGNQRMYDEEEVAQRLKKISDLSREGYPLNLIRKKLLGI